MKSLLNIATITGIALACCQNASYSQNSRSSCEKNITRQHSQSIIGAGILKSTPAQRALYKAHEVKIERMENQGSEDLMVGDYRDAVAVYQNLIKSNNQYICYKEDLAYALLGMGNKLQAMQVLHDAYYANGNNLYTSGCDRRAYSTYALLEDEAGNWKEAVLAYSLAGVESKDVNNAPYGIPNFNKTGGYGVPNIDIVFSADKPEPVLLAAAAHAVIGVTLSFPNNIITGNDGHNHAYDQSIAQLQRAVALAPNWPIGWYYLGVTLKRANRSQQATEAFNQAVKTAGTNKKLLKLINW